MWASMDKVFFISSRREIFIFTEINVKVSNEEWIKFWLRVSQHTWFAVAVKEISWPTSFLLLLLYDRYILEMIWGYPGKV